MISTEWEVPRSNVSSAAGHEAAIGYAIAAVGGRAPERLPLPARRMIEDARNQLIFGATSIWEVAIESGLGRSDFRADARLLRRGLLANGYDDMAIAGEHVVAMANLSPNPQGPLRPS